MGIAKKKLRAYMKEYPADYIQKRIQYVQNQLAKKGKTITNIGGYFIRMMEEKTLIDPIQKKKNEAIQKKIKEKSEKIKQENLEKDYNLLKQEYSSARFDVLDRSLKV